MKVEALARISDPQGFASYFEAGRPVVVQGLARRMGAFAWTDAHIIATLGDARPLVRLPDGRRARMPVAAFFDYLADPGQYASGVGLVYLTDFHLRPSYGDATRTRLADDAACPLPLPGAWAEWFSLYAGPAGTGSSMHQDIFATHTWLAQLQGQKLWRLCPPDGFEGEAGLDVDAFGDATIECPVYEALLDAGDVIYLPPDWWHQVRNLTTPSVAISGNFCSFAAAQAALDEVEAGVGPASLREVHRTMWSTILAEQAGA